MGEATPPIPLTLLTSRRKNDPSSLAAQQKPYLLYIILLAVLMGNASPFVGYNPPPKQCSPKCPNFTFIPRRVYFSLGYPPNVGFPVGLALNQTKKGVPAKQDTHSATLTPGRAIPTFALAGLPAHPSADPR